MRGGAVNVRPPGKAKLREFDNVIKLNPKVKSW